MSPVMSKLSPDPSSVQDLTLQGVPNISGLKKICNCEEVDNLTCRDQIVALLNEQVAIWSSSSAGLLSWGWEKSTHHYFFFWMGFQVWGVGFHGRNNTIKVIIQHYYCYFEGVQYRLNTVNIWETSTARDNDVCVPHLLLFPVTATSRLQKN